MQQRAWARFEPGPLPLEEALEQGYFILVSMYILYLKSMPSHPLVSRNDKIMLLCGSSQMII